MQTADLLKYIENPNLLDHPSVEQLQKLVNDFPYFQPAHLLLMMASKKWDASVYQQHLKKTAIVSPNRLHLFKLIHQMETSAEPVGNEKIQDVAPETEKQVVSTEAEDTKHGLDIKATEIATESALPEKATKTKVQSPEALFEAEIQKSVVTSYVEKEILKTPDLHKPKVREEPESFVEWLSLMKKNNGQPNQQLSEGRLKPKEKEEPGLETTPALSGKTEPDTRKEKQKALIDRIIENNPGIIRGKEEQKFFTAEIKAKESLLESEHLVTETLARIYALQGSVNKAVRAYEILSLKFPQKSAYFATLIYKLKNNQ